MSAAPRIPAWLAANPQLARAAGVPLVPIPPREERELPIEPEPVHRILRRESSPGGDRQAVRRDKLRAANMCINGWSHGPRTHGSRCKRCDDKRRNKGASNGSDE